MSFSGKQLYLPNGFLPPVDPLQRLSNDSDLNGELNRIIQALPRLIKDKTLRAKLDDIDERYESKPEIAVHTTNDFEVNCALLVLLMLAQAYIWAPGGEPVNHIPYVLSQNIIALAKIAKRLPVLTYADYVLQNWRLIDEEGEITLANVKSLFTFTGTKDEEWFIKIHVVIEAICAKAIISAQEGFGIAVATSLENDQNLKRLAQLHQVIGDSLKEASEILRQMKKGCGTDFFYHTLRHYLDGTEMVKKKDHLDQEEIGVRFATALTKHVGPLISKRGLSGAQSSILPALDAFLGVPHKSDEMQKVLLELQDYMPHQARFLIEQFASVNIEDIIRKIPDENLRIEILKQRQYALEQLANFRYVHISLVRQFIYRPAAQLGIGIHDVKGTGGTQTDEFLFERARETRDAGKECGLSAKL